MQRPLANNINRVSQQQNSSTLPHHHPNSTPTLNPYDLLHMTTPSAHRSLLRLTLASLLLQSRAYYTTSPCMSCLSGVLSRLLEVLSVNVKEGGVEAAVWLSGTLSRPYHCPNMLLYNLMGEEGMKAIIMDLIAYLKVVKEAEMKGPSGLKDGTGRDALQTVGLVPNEYRLMHNGGRLDEQSIVNTMSEMHK